MLNIPSSCSMNHRIRMGLKTLGTAIVKSFPNLALFLSSGNMSHFWMREFKRRGLPLYYLFFI